jgi:hypothetical protein
MKFRVKVGKYNYLPAAMGRAATAAEILMALQIAKDTEPYVPALTGAFSRNARVLRNLIIYQGDQAEFLWEGVKMKPVSGGGPFYIEDVGWRYRKGTKLMPTTEPLKYTKDMHPKAGDHWIDRSEAENGKKWAEIAGRMIVDGYNR